MGLVSTIALFIPILLILTLRLGAYKSFPFLVISFANVFIYALMTEGYIRTNADVVRWWGVGNNLMDAPLLLLFLSYFSTSAIFTRRLTILIFSFIVFESVVVMAVGFNVRALSIILGPEILVVFALSLFLFIRQSKITIAYRKGIGKTLISASLVFAYGCYGILYVLFYLIKTTHVADAFLIYFLVVTFYSLMMSTGIIFEKIRIQKLFELKRSRKELHDIYKDTKTDAPLRTAMLDFDRESWN